MAHSTAVWGNNLKKEINERWGCQWEMIPNHFCVILDKPSLSYLLTNWFAYLYGRIQSPRPDVMPDRREGITRAAGFGFACIDTQAS